MKIVIVTRMVLITYDLYVFDNNMTPKPRHEFSLRMYRGGNVTSLGVAMCLGDGFLNGKFG